MISTSFHIPNARCAPSRRIGVTPGLEEIFIIYGLWSLVTSIFSKCWMHVHALHNTQWGIYASEFCGPLIYVPFACGLCAFFGRRSCSKLQFCLCWVTNFSAFVDKKFNKDSFCIFFLNREINTLKALAYSLVLINLQGKALQLSFGFKNQHLLALKQMYANKKFILFLFCIKGLQKLTLNAF